MWSANSVGEIGAPLGSVELGDSLRRSADNPLRASVAAESTLVARARSGDRSAYRELVERYQRRAFAVALEVVRNREDAEDIVQEAFVKAYLSLDDFRGESAFYTWLYRIVYNMAIDYRRRVARRGGDSRSLDGVQVSDDSDLGPVAMGHIESPHDNLIRKEQRRSLRSALDELSEEHRTVILLREVEGLSYAEIARVVGVSRGTVMSRLHYARKRLQSVLKPETVAEGSEAAGDPGAESQSRLLSVK